MAPRIALGEWEESVGFLPWKVTVYEEASRNGTLYLRWRQDGNWKRKSLKRSLRTASSSVEACTDADLVLVLTDWDEFCSIDPVALSGVVAHPRVIDARLVLDPEKWRAAGWELFVLGRGSR